MTPTQVSKLATAKDPYIKELFEFLHNAGSFGTIAGDAMTNVCRLKASDIEELAQIGHRHAQARYINAGIHIQTPSEAYTDTFLKIAGDNLINQKNGFGTLLDPTAYTHSDVPIMLGPMEGTNIYASGGLPADIIDKKARAMCMKGVSFHAYDDVFWNNDKIDQLEQAADSTGLNDHVSDAICDAFIYGGSVLYPVFKKESPTSLLRSFDRLRLEKGCIDRWVNTDRWNTTIVPSYIVTDADYLKPKTLYIPQGAVEVNTSRMALIKPRPMPYWATLYNIGWSPSDFSGWLRSYYGYKITMQSVPVMAQQMSLLLYKMPLDGLNAAIGPDKVRELMSINEEKMAEWSALSPKAVNMVGEVEVVDRTYSGFDQFIGSMKSDLAAQCEIPEPSLWHTPNKGFSDNTQESLLKQSETLQQRQLFIERSMRPMKDILIAHVFGQDSEEWKHRDDLKLTFNKPIISTEKDLAEVGARFAASVSSLTQAGIAPDNALNISKQFFPTVRITQDMIDQAKASYEKAQKSQTLGSKIGNIIGKANTTGSFTKAK